MGIAGLTCAVGLGFSLAVTSTMALGAATQRGLSALQGTWLDSGFACDAVFVSAGRGSAFKKPVDMFAPAFIIAGNRLRTPHASCRVKAVKEVADRQILSLDCATSVAVSETKAMLSRSSDGSIRRFTNDQDPVGSSYRRCDR